MEKGYNIANDPKEVGRMTPRGWGENLDLKWRKETSFPEKEEKKVGMRADA